MEDDWGEEDYEVEEVLENATHCEECDELTGHEILKQRAKGKGFDYLVKCEQCSYIHNLDIRPPALISIPFTLTDGPESETINLEVDEDEEFIVEDVFDQSEMLWRINQILVGEGRKVKYATAIDVKGINAIRTDKVRVKLTMTRGEDSEADVLIVPQETTYTGGNLIEHNDSTWRIRAIHTGSGRTMKGTVKAADIKRMYLHEPPRPEYFAPRTPRERRQAWKEGRLGDNPNPERPQGEIKKGVQPPTKRKKRPRN
ncbi:MAG: hypothetical protein CXT70_04965 [Methanobacteriota archaeon]|nr:MAG: hypothetical protein CXT70_04965 [Euryarchaeota archaeon]